jgi:hypothetical protein
LPDQTGTPGQSDNGDAGKRGEYPLPQRPDKMKLRLDRALLARKVFTHRAYAGCDALDFVGEIVG